MCVCVCSMWLNVIRVNCFWIFCHLRIDDAIVEMWVWGWSEVLFKRVFVEVGQCLVLDLLMCVLHSIYYNICKIFAKPIRNQNHKRYSNNNISIYLVLQIGWWHQTTKTTKGNEAKKKTEIENWISISKWQQSK